jgi:hypothetical protein
VGCRLGIMGRLGRIEEVGRQNYGRYCNWFRYRRLESVIQFLSYMFHYICPPECLQHYLTTPLRIVPLTPRGSILKAQALSVADAFKEAVGRKITTPIVYTVRVHICVIIPEICDPRNSGIEESINRGWSNKETVKSPLKPRNRSCW